MQIFDKHKPRVYSDKNGKYVTCCIRDKRIKATEEEVVRQSVIFFLLSLRRFENYNFELEESVNYTDNSRGRPDIVLRDSDGKVVFVVECKKPSVMLGDNVRQQAIRYAQKLRSKRIWLTNGAENVFFSKDKNEWKNVNSIEFLKIKGIGFEREVKFPAKATPAFIRRHLQKENIAKFSDTDMHELLSKNYDIDFLYKLLCLQKLIYTANVRAPFSINGLHILEDRGIKQLHVPNPGGGFNGLYRILLVATEGAVEAVGIGLHRWSSDNSFRLCMAFIKKNRIHHSLQLSSDGIEVVGNKRVKISHNARMGGRSIKKDKVLEAIVEACREDIISDDNAFPICLGTIPQYENINWSNSKNFLSNLCHYALIRSNLRESNRYQKA